MYTIPTMLRKLKTHAYPLPSSIPAIVVFLAYFLVLCKAFSHHHTTSQKTRMLAQHQFAADVQLCSLA